MLTLRDRLAAARAGWVSGGFVRIRRAVPRWTASSLRPRHTRAGTPAAPPTQQQSRAQTLFQAVTALTAVAALLFTARSLNYTADATRATRDQIDLAAQGQVAERFSQAIDQLGQTGPDKLSIRLGGIYSLERLMRDSPDDEPTVIEVLCAFVRTSARKPATPVGPTKLPVAPEDVRAAITVLARRPNPDQEQNSRLDFTGTQLSLLGISLPGTDLAGMEMILGYLRDANLRGANLTGANVRGTDLRDADLRGANLRDANLRYTDFSGADLNGVVGLNSEMLQCSYVNDQTRLPPGVVRPPDVPVSERPSC